MNKAETRRQQEKTVKAVENAKPAHSAIPSSDQQTLTIQQAIDLAVQHHNAGG
jgi:hypothetical protein